MSLSMLLSPLLLNFIIGYGPASNSRRQKDPNLQAVLSEKNVWSNAAKPLIDVENDGQQSTLLAVRQVEVPDKQVWANTPD